jgi:hypothetical protein
MRRSASLADGWVSKRRADHHGSDREPEGGVHDLRGESAGQSGDAAGDLTAQQCGQ